MKIILYLLISFIPFSGIAQTETAWDSIQRRDYSLRFPATWRVDTITASELVDLFIFSSKDSANDKFVENVNVLIHDLAGLQFTFDKYIEFNEAQIRKLSTDLVIIENTRIVHDRDSYHKFLFTSRQGIFNLTTEQYYFFSKDKAFVITFSAETKNYPAYRQVGENILDSFQLYK